MITRDYIRMLVIRPKVHLWSVWVRVLLVMTLVQGSCVEGMLVYSKELEMVNMYLDTIVPKYTTFNMTVYNDEVTVQCPFQPQKRNAILLFEQCQTRINDKYAKACKLWTPIMDPPVHHKHHFPDCQYSISFQGTVTETSAREADIDVLRFTEFKFVAHQSCSPGNTTIPGGATFDIFGYTEHAIASCVAADSFDNTYEIVCKAPRVLHGSADIDNECIYLTVVLEHEHYDAVSLVLSSWIDTYSSVRHVLMDNVTFCRESKGPTKPLNPHHDALLRRSRAPPSLVPDSGSISPNITIYSGVWMRQHEASDALSDGFKCPLLFVESIEKCSDSHGFNSSSCHGTWRKSMQLTTAQQAELVSSLSNERFVSPSWWENRRGCFEEAYQYKNTHNRTEILDPDVSIVSKATNIGTKYSFRPLQMKSSHGHLLLDWSVPSFERPDVVREGVSSFQFVGASHMRYMYMSIVEEIYGAKEIELVPAKMSYSLYKNFRYNGVKYASEHARFINSACELFRYERRGNGILIVQAGDWDLTIGISRVLRDPHFGQTMVSAFRKILEGSECDSVKHVVYVTAVPYPICQSDSGSENCARFRSYRTNTATAAINEYVLRHLLAMQVNGTKKLSIVDAYSIISPRIMLNENYDAVCANHYSCALDNGRGSAIMVHTPGGMALNQALMHAIASVT
jgi:hypothetical protein